MPSPTKKDLKKLDEITKYVKLFKVKEEKNMPMIYFRTGYRSARMMVVE